MVHFCIFAAFPLPHVTLGVYALFCFITTDLSLLYLIMNSITPVPRQQQTPVALPKWIKRSGLFSGVAEILNLVPSASCTSHELFPFVRDLSFFFCTSLLRCAIFVPFPMASLSSKLASGFRQPGPVVAICVAVGAGCLPGFILVEGFSLFDCRGDLHIRHFFRKLCLYTRYEK